MTFINDAIDVGDFDREYELGDLFPLEMAEELLSTIDGTVTATLLLADGRCYYRGDEATANGQDVIAEAGGAAIPAACRKDTPRRCERFDLIHELECIGTLVLESPATQADRQRLRDLGRFAAGFINRMIDLNHRNRMATGLHGQVVTESYAQLQEKAEQLALSEARYRRLSEDLEVEVEKKTREIRETQLVVMQQEKLAAIGQLAAGMAHEINNPIGFVLSNLNSLKSGTDEMALLIARYRKLHDLLLAGTEAGATASRIRAQLSTIQQYIQEIDLDYLLEDTECLIDESLDGAKRIKIIVQNLRDFTHPSVDTPEDVNVNDCLETTLVILSGYIQPGVTIRRPHADIPNIRCQLREINHVFFNVLKNAFQAVGDSGEVRIRTDGDDDVVTVSITDTGPGIPAADRARIFEPFFTTRDVGEGTGLGLFHAHSMVTALGGSITVENADGGGSTFVIRIPTAGAGEKMADDNGTRAPIAT